MKLETGKQAGCRLYGSSKSRKAELHLSDCRKNLKERAEKKILKMKKKKINTMRTQMLLTLLYALFIFQAFLLFLFFLLHAGAIAGGVETNYCR